MKAGLCWEDRTQPLVPALAGKGRPEPGTQAADIPREQLPRDEAGLLLRPGVVLFGEQLDEGCLEAAEEATANCDLFITVGLVCGAGGVPGGAGGCWEAQGAAGRWATAGAGAAGAAQEAAAALLSRHLADAACACACRTPHSS